MSAADWVYLYDDVNRTHYFANISSGVTCWERPAVLDEPAPVPVTVQRRATRRSTKVVAKWVEFFDDEYAHRDLNQTFLRLHL